MKSSTPRRLHRPASPRLGAPGSHSVGAGIGAVTGSVTAGAVGTMAGPAGAITGAAMGALVGGLAGRCVAKKINPTVLEAFWRAKRSYQPATQRIDDFRQVSV